MRLGINLGYFGAAAPSQFVPMVQKAESLGYHSAWTAEAYGSDSVVPLIWAGAHTSKINLGTAIMQMPARTPANTAMTAATIDMLSDGRFLLGLGLSGPQVVEGWHGEAYGKPLGKTREYVEIVREILRREKPLEHHGEHYDIPYTGPGATGLGKPLKLIIHPKRNEIPIYLASIGPKNVKLTAEIADGWLPLFFAPQRWKDAFGDAFTSTDFAKFDVAPTVSVVLGDDVDACRSMVKPQLALYVGGMGARGQNFYNDLVCRYGFEAEATKIQDLYLDGKRAEAIAAVPDELVDEVALCGPRDRIKDLLGMWQESPVTTMIVGSGQPEVLEMMAELHRLAMASPAETTNPTRPKRRPKFGIVVVVALLFRFGREVIQRVAFGRYGILGFLGVLVVGIGLLTVWRLVQRRQARRRGTVFTPESVVAQVAQSGFAGPAFDGDGTLFGTSLLVYDQHPKVIEVLTEYELFDASGSRLGFVHQVNQSQWKKVARFVLPLDQFLTHRFDVTDADDVPVLRLVRPWKIFLTKLHVFRDGVQVGTIRQRNVFWKIRFDLEDAVGNVVGHLRADNVRAWDFGVVDHAEQPVAQVFKTWEGWARAAFTRADHYVLRIEQPLDGALQSLTIAVPLAVDLALKQDNRR